MAEDKEIKKHNNPPPVKIPIEEGFTFSLKKLFKLLIFNK